LTLTAGLLDVPAFGFGFLANRFAISDLRTANIGLHAVFAKHAVDNDFEVKFAHAGNQSLAGVRLGGNTEGRIFLSETLQRDAKLVLVRFRLRLDGDRNNRRREIDIFEDDLFLFIAERVARVDALETNDGANIACAHFFDFFAFVGVHLQHAANAFACALAGIENVAASLQYAGIDADVRNMSDEGSDMILNASAENG